MKYKLLSFMPLSIAVMVQILGHYLRSVRAIEGPVLLLLILLTIVIVASRRSTIAKTHDVALQTTGINVWWTLRWYGRHLYRWGIIQRLLILLVINVLMYFFVHWLFGMQVRVFR
jgi:hypothetical protein